MKIAIASDHGGFKLKEALRSQIPHIEWIDLGCDSEASVDYPDFAEKAANAVQEHLAERAIIICGTGIGISIAANKMNGIRAALVHDEFTAEMARRHNDANVLALGARVLGEELAVKLTKIFIETPFEGERHQRRLDKIALLEQKNS